MLEQKRTIKQKIYSNLKTNIIVGYSIAVYEIGYMTI